jgi:hypothetical protein
VFLAASPVGPDFPGLRIQNSHTPARRSEEVWAGRREAPKRSIRPTLRGAPGGSKLLLDLQLVFELDDQVSSGRGDE